MEFIRSRGELLNLVPLAVHMALFSKQAFLVESHDRYDFSLILVVHVF